MKRSALSPFRILRLGLVLVLSSLPLIATPPSIGHQGRIAVGGVNFDGTGYFKFALMDGAGSASLWSNDWSSLNGAEPNTSLALPVTKGHYAVGLGESTPIPATVFANHDDVRLRVWFSQTGSAGTFELLTPDRRITSGGYALSAKVAERVASGAVSGLDFPDGSQTDVVTIDPSRIVPKDSEGSGITDPLEVELQGDFAYVIDRGSDTLLIFDVSDPDNVVPRGASSVGLSNPYSLAVNGNYVYVADRSTDSLHVFDVTDPDNIVARDVSNEGVTDPIQVAVEGDRAYILDWGTDEMHVFDVSNPTNIFRIATTTANFQFFTEITVVDQMAYVLDRGTKLLQIFDVTNPFFPAALDFDKTNMSYPSDIAVVGNFAYVVDTLSNGLQVFDVTNPSVIVPRGFIGTGLDDPSDIAVQGATAYITDEVSGKLHVFDVSDPDAPAAMDSLGTNITSPQDVAVAGGFAYVLDSGSDLLHVFGFTPRVIVNEAIQLAGDLVDASGTTGSPGQVLVSTSSGVAWINPPSDGDNSATNELQTLGLSDANLSIGPSGNSVPLAGIGPSLADNSIPGSKIAEGTLGSEHLASGALTIDGAIVAEEFQYDTAKTFTKRILPTEFHARSTLDEVWRQDGRLIMPLSPPFNVWVVASFDLPDGATITSVKVLLGDTGFYNFTFGSISFDPANPTTLGTGATISSASESSTAKQAFELLSAPQSVVPKSIYTINAGLNTNTSIIYGAVVEYTHDTVHP